MGTLSDQLTRPNGGGKATEDIEAKAMASRKFMSHQISKILDTHAIFGKFWPNNRLATPFRVVAPWEILDPPLD